MGESSQSVTVVALLADAPTEVALRIARDLPLGSRTSSVGSGGSTSRW